VTLRRIAKLSSAVAWQFTKGSSMAVIELVKYVNRETIAVLQALADMARRGEVTAVAVCYRTKGGEEAAFTGAYRAQPALGVNAANRLSWKLTQMQDELTGPP
jgi:hypothetical protein